MIQAEIEQLRPLLVQHQQRREELLQELEGAQEEEKQAQHALELSRLTQQEKRRRLRKTLQHAVQTVVMEQRSMKAMSTPEPELHVLEERLDESLKGLRHQIHRLKYSEQDKQEGALRIQNWWRCILAARVRRLLRISKGMWELKRKMSKASVTIQRWYRAHVVRLRWQDVLKAATERRRKSLEERLEHQTKVVKVLQRAIRIYLAKRRLARSQEAGREVVEDRIERGSIMYVDNWRPASKQQELRDSLPPEDLELKKMREAGLIPFYSRTSNTLRHRIGGPFALRIQFRLGIGIGQREPAEETNAEAPEELKQDSTSASPKKKRISQSKALNAEDDFLGGWEIYPEGLSEGFLKTLTYDLRGSGRSPTSRRPRPRPRDGRPRPRESPRRRPCTKPVEVGPFQTERRAEQREHQQQEETAAQIKAEAIKAVAHLQHPLLEGLLPNVPMHVRPAPPSAPPMRPRPNFGCGRFHQECSWSDAKSFYAEGRRSEAAASTWRGGGWRHL